MPAEDPQSASVRSAAFNWLRTEVDRRGDILPRDGLRGNVASPGRHADVLQAREAALGVGEEQFQDWDAAKKDIRRELS